MSQSVLGFLSRPGVWFGGLALATFLALLILTYFHIVLGEMIPKSVSLQAPDRTSRAVTPVLLGLQMIALPLIRFLSFAGNGLLKLFGIDRGGLSNEHVRTPEELRYIVRESQAGGMLRRESAAVVQEAAPTAQSRATRQPAPRVRRPRAPPVQRTTAARLWAPVRPAQAAFRSGRRGSGRRSLLMPPSTTTCIT